MLSDRSTHEMCVGNGEGDQEQFSRHSSTPPSAAPPVHPRVAQAILGSQDYHLNDSGFCLDVLQAALHFVHRGKTFAEVVNAATEFAGPANYCPVLAGAIAGARFGGKAILSSEKGLLEHCRAGVVRRCQQAAEKLLAGPGVV